MHEKYPSMLGMFGFLDGLKLKIHPPSDPEMENAYYNGWTSDHYISNVFLFTPDGCVSYAVMNCPGKVLFPDLEDYTTFSLTKYLTVSLLSLTPLFRCMGAQATRSNAAPKGERWTLKLQSIWVQLNWKTWLECANPPNGEIRHWKAHFPDSRLFSPGRRAASFVQLFCKIVYTSPIYERDLRARVKFELYGCRGWNVNGE